MKKLFILFTLLLTIISVFAQISDMPVSVGIGYCGTEKHHKKIGIIGSFGIPIRSSEIRFEAGHFNFPFGANLNNLSLSTLEMDYLYRGTIAFRKMGDGNDHIFTSVGAGLNYNYLNGGCETRHTTPVHLSPNPIQNDSSYSATIDHKTAFGFALYLGAGIYIFPKLSIFWEYSLKAVFYNTNKGTTGEEAFACGGWRLGIRYQPFKSL